MSGEATDPEFDADVAPESPATALSDSGPVPADAPEAQQDAAWYADGLRFKCTQCGNCCTGAPGYVWFGEDEAQAMADHLGIDTREFYQRYTKRKMGRWTLDEVRYQRQYDCVFLERDAQGKGKCSIYEVRPNQCRTWPFWLSNLTSPRAWAAAAEDCPGMILPDGTSGGGGNFVPIEKIRIELAKNPEGL
ncbi:MAG: YkgJ family cysteine cluster protein [Planctomycetota bacterium]